MSKLSAEDRNLIREVRIRSNIFVLMSCLDNAQNGIVAASNVLSALDDDNVVEYAVRGEGADMRRYIQEAATALRAVYVLHNEAAARVLGQQNVREAGQ